MNGMRAIGLVTVRELRERGLSKSYLVSWLILAVLIGAGFAVPLLFDGGAHLPTRPGRPGWDEDRRSGALGAHGLGPGGDHRGLVLRQS